MSVSVSVSGAGRDGGWGPRSRRCRLGLWRRSCRSSGAPPGVPNKLVKVLKLRRGEQGPRRQRSSSISRSRSCSAGIGSGRGGGGGMARRCRRRRRRLHLGAERGPIDGGAAGPRGDRLLLLFSFFFFQLLCYCSCC